MSTLKSDARMGELLSGYMDGELTQQDRQRVDLHLQQDPEYRALYEELTALRTQLNQSVGEAFGEDTFRESFKAPGQRLLVAAGWSVIIGSAVLLAGVLLANLVADDSISVWIKWLIALPYAGLGLLFVAVVRRRLREARTDKYSDVEI